MSLTSVDMIEPCAVHKKVAWRATLFWFNILIMFHIIYISMFACNVWEFWDAPYTTQRHCGNRSANRLHSELHLENDKNKHVCCHFYLSHIFTFQARCDEQTADVPRQWARANGPEPSSSWLGSSPEKVPLLWKPFCLVYVLSTWFGLSD